MEGFSGMWWKAGWASCKMIPNVNVLTFELPLQDQTKWVCRQVGVDAPHAALASVSASRGVETCLRGARSKATVEGPGQRQEEAFTLLTLGSMARACQSTDERVTREEKMSLCLVHTRGRRSSGLPARCSFYGGAFKEFAQKMHAVEKSQDL